MLAASPIKRGAADWPMSREEKTCQVIRLFDQDVKAADRLLEASEYRESVLREEVLRLRREVRSCHTKELADHEGTRSRHGVPRRCRSSHRDQQMLEGVEAATAATHGLRQAMEEATGVLRTLLTSRGPSGPVRILRRPLLEPSPTPSQVLEANPPPRSGRRWCLGDRSVEDTDNCYHRMEDGKQERVKQTSQQAPLSSLELFLGQEVPDFPFPRKPEGLMSPQSEIQASASSWQRS